MAGLVASPNLSTTHTLCHFHSDSRWYTGIAICNPDPISSAVVNMVAYDASGATLGTASLTVPARNKVSKLLSDSTLFGSLRGTGWIQLTSTLPVSALDLYGDTLAGGIAALPSAPTGNTLVLPHFHVSDRWWTGISVANPNSSQVNVHLVAYDALGTQLAETTELIPAKGKLNGFVESVIPGIPSGQTGWVRVESVGGPVAGLVVYGDKKSVPNEIAALPAVSASTEIYLSDFRTNATWWTGISLVNPDPTQSANVTLNAQAPDGTAIDTRIQVVPPLSKIVGFASNVFDLGAYTEGWVEARSDLPIVGIELLNANDAGQQAWGLAGIESQWPSTNITFTHYDVTAIWWTIFALANPDDTFSAEPAFVAYKNDGVLVGSVSRTLQANGRMSEFVDDLLGFPKKAK